MPQQGQRHRRVVGHERFGGHQFGEVLAGDPANLTHLAVGEAERAIVHALKAPAEQVGVGVGVTPTAEVDER